MKKRLLTLLLLFSAIAIIIAQENKLAIGITTGPNLRHFHGTGIDNRFDKSAIGFSAGLSFEYLFSKKISLFTAIQYDKKGYAQLITFTNGSVVSEKKYPQNYNYLILPLLFRYRIQVGAKTHFYVNAGPYIGFLMSSISTVPMFMNGESTRLNYTAYSNRFDLGTSIGIGAALPISDKLEIEFEVRENYGLLNTNKTSTYTLKTNSINLLVNFKYKI